MSGNRVDSISMIGMKSFVEKQNLKSSKKEILDLLPVQSDGIVIERPVNYSKSISNLFDLSLKVHNQHLSNMISVLEECFLSLLMLIDIISI